MIAKFESPTMKNGKMYTTPPPVPEPITIIAMPRIARHNPTENTLFIGVTSRYRFYEYGTDGISIIRYFSLDIKRALEEGEHQMTPKEGKSRYLFKITVVGPDDELIKQFLEFFNKDIYSIDGIQITSTGVETQQSEVRTLFMSPRHSALDLLFSLTYKGARAAIIVLPKADPKMETKFRNEIRENLGENVPTRVIIGPLKQSDEKRFAAVLEEIISEILPN